MTPAAAYDHYLDLQAFLAWGPDDAARLPELRRLAEPHLDRLVADFYANMLGHPKTRAVLDGSQAQLDRLRRSLRGWLDELLAGTYDAAYVERRWRVGLRHVEIGLDQAYANIAMSRLRNLLEDAVGSDWVGTPRELNLTLQTLNKLVDLDLAVIERAYHAERRRRRETAERLAAIGQVAGGIAHELRNPLNVIHTSVYFLLHARTDDPAKREEHLRRIERQVVVANSVITALSDFARMPAPDFQPICPRECLRDAIEQHAPPPGVLVEERYPATPLMIRGDRRQLAIVFSNLLRNAYDAMPEGGAVVAAVRLEGGRVVASVSDVGCGMDADVLKRITEPLYSTKTRGIGLGLAISRAILDKHQAELNVVSEPGRGSTFSVRFLPAEPPPAAKPAPESVEKHVPDSVAKEAP